MNNKFYFVEENFYPKKEHFEEVLSMLKDTSKMLKEQDGMVMHFVLNPEQKNGAITGIGVWTSREKFTNFMKSEHAEKIMKTGLSDKVKSWTTDIKAQLYTVEDAWHAESHD